MKKQMPALGKATSSILAFVLAIGLVPSGAMAYAAEAAAQLPASNASGAVANDASTDSAIEGEAASGADDASDANVADAEINAEAAVGEGADTAANASEGESANADALAEAPAVTYTASTNGVISAQVPLSTGSAITTVGDIQVGGLTYTINPDDPTTVSVTGVAATKPEGDVAVQAQIANGTTTYKVTNISTYLQMGGGGSPILRNPAKTR